jgi:hypothetical protein
MWEIRNEYQILINDLKELYNLGELRVDVRAILLKSCVVKKQDVEIATGFMVMNLCVL